jgi:hypothetical protein
MLDSWLAMVLSYLSDSNNAMLSFLLLFHLLELRAGFFSISEGYQAVHMTLALRPAYLQKLYLKTFRPFQLKISLQVSVTLIGRS